MPRLSREVERPELGSELGLHTWDRRQTAVQPLFLGVQKGLMRSVFGSDCRNRERCADEGCEGSRPARAAQARRNTFGTLALFARKEFLV